MARWSCYRGLVAGAAPGYLTAGLALGAIGDEQVVEPSPGQDDVTAIIEATAARLGEEMAAQGGVAYWRSEQWRRCGAQPAPIAILAAPAFVALAPAAALELLRVANSTWWAPEAEAARWRALAPALSGLTEVAAQLPPPYQAAFVETIAHVYDWTVDGDGDVAVALDRTVELCRRLARPPFGTKAVLGPVLPAMALLVGGAAVEPLRRALRAAPDASWLTLEDACRRANQARVFEYGLGRLARFTPALLTSTFTTTPGPLLQTAGLVRPPSPARSRRLAGRVRDPRLDRRPRRGAARDRDARDPRGAVIARQLLVLSEADELLCFPVYGSTDGALHQRFRDFDQAFAARLGLPIYRRDPDADPYAFDYEIAAILSHDWHHDGVGNDPEISVVGP